MEVYVVTSSEYDDSVAGVFYKGSRAEEKKEALNAQELDWPVWHVEKWKVK